MNKSMKKYIDKEYNKIFASYSSGYLLGVKNLNNELEFKGLLYAGVSVEMTFRMFDNLTMECIDKIDKLLTFSQQKFKRRMHKNDVKNFIDKCIDTTNGHIDLREKEMNDMFEKRFSDKIFISTLEMSFINLKRNVNAKYRDIGETIVLFNNDRKLDINIILSIISIVIGVLGLIATIIFGILPLLG
jgi:hypothetical protein